MGDASKARGVEHAGVLDQRATPLAAMQRRPNALVILRRALRRRVPCASAFSTVAPTTDADPTLRTRTEDPQPTHRLRRSSPIQLVPESRSVFHPTSTLHLRRPRRPSAAVLTRHLG